MKKIYSSAYVADCDLLRVSLSLAGIESTMKNEFGNPIGLVLVGGVTTFTWPEVWVNDGDYAEAVKIADATIEAARECGTAKPNNPATALPLWRCPTCGEEVEETMNACWKCEAERPQQ